MGKFTVPETPRVGSATVMLATVAEATSVPGTVAVKRVVPEKVVASVAPFHCTCEAVVKLDPMAVIVNEALPGVVEAGSSE